jgi:type II secretory pathway component PulF
MTKYAFKAKDWNGKTIKGELELSNKKEVVDSIKSSGLVPLIVVENINKIIKAVSMIRHNVDPKSALDYYFLS